MLQLQITYMKIQPVHPKGNQSWIFTGRTDAEAETPIIWPPDVKNWVTRKDPDAGKDWSQVEKGTTEDKMASPVWWTWVWSSSGNWWWTRKPGMLKSMGLQRIWHYWATELNSTFFFFLKHGLYEMISPMGNHGIHWLQSMHSHYGIHCQVLITCHVWDLFSSRSKVTRCQLPQSLHG